MKLPETLLIALALTATSHASNAADSTRLNQAFQDHIAYVATFVMPVLFEKCEQADNGYLQKAAPLYFRYVNTHQDQIERGRMLTLAELAPNDTQRSYRERTITQRIGVMDSGTPEQKAKTCKGALAVLGGMQVPGEWPPRD
jgi:hypothetical protein